MDNEYTRREKICLLIGNMCDREDKDCSICIAEEELWQIEQSRADLAVSTSETNG